MNLGGGLNRPRASETDPPSFLEWTTAPLAHDVDVIGPIELQWDVACSAPDTAFIAFLQDVYDHGNATNITAAYLRAGLRKVDEEQQTSSAGASLQNLRSNPDWPEGPIPHSVSAQCSTVQSWSQVATLSHDGRPKQGCPSAARIQACFGRHQFINMVFSYSRLSLPVVE